MSDSTTQVATNERLAALIEVGTSVWLDELGRELLERGELERLIAEDGLRGVTSNPAIFERAIFAGSSYDQQIAELAASGLDAEAILEELVISDVRAACDRLRPVHEALGGADGFVSLEVSPHLARDTEGTLRQARDFWRRVARPNLMIKIPGTAEGLAAIEQATYEGINVNVTLLFSVAAYERVAEAYIRGMERRLREGLSLDVRSVASFFVSRVDTEVDRRLAAIGREDLRGRAAVANARAAYRSFLRIFRGARFAALRAAGCPVQRPLWASTGVKDPAYPETFYVAALAGPDTVSTMPLKTLRACERELEVSGPTVEIDPSPDLAALAEAGIDLEEVASLLLEEGIDKFVRPFEQTLTGVARKAARALARDGAAAVALDRRARVAAADWLERGRSERLVERLLERDASAVGDPSWPELADRLGWVDAPARSLAELPKLRELAAQLTAPGIDDVVLLGMGGSSLGAAALVTLGGRDAASQDRRFHVLDSTHPRAIAALAATIEPQRTLLICASKSGTTLETVSHLRFFAERIGDPQRIVAITDPGTPLAEQARRDGFAAVVAGDPEVGGRYSVLTVFGLVPALLAGVDPEPELKAAESVREALLADPTAALALGAALGALAADRRYRLLLPIDEPARVFALWLEQLLAESSGKQGRGILPVPVVAAGGRELAPRDAVRCLHTASEGARFPSAPEGTYDSPLPTVAVAGQGLGGAFFLWETATAVACRVLEVNPFDQPNVQEAKRATQSALAEGSRAPSEGREAALRLLRSTRPPSYVAFQAYLPPSPPLDRAGDELCAAVVRATGCAATFGYGPRYLHSTGQLHKGGPPDGVFVQLLDDDHYDLAIPGADYGFRALIEAQAAGDRAALEARGRAVVSLRLSGDPAAALAALTREITA